MLGLRRGHNVLVGYDPAWALAFEQERARLAILPAATVLAVEHYGSTAVPGLRAKPIIDILLGIDALEHWERLREPLVQLDYRHFPDANVEGHQVFTRFRATGDRTHLLHVVRFRSAHWHRNLAFRDRLRGDPALRAAYQAQKEAAAARAPEDRLAYNALKSDFIQAVMADLPPDP